MPPLNNEEKLAAAAAPVKFSNGVELLISPLTDKDILELNIWVRRYYLNTMRDSLGSDASSIERDRVERIAQETASSLNWYSGRGVEIMSTPEGMSQIVLQSAKKQHPNLTFEEVHAILLSPENLNRANEVFEELNIEKKAGRVSLVKKKQPPGRKQKKVSR